MVRAYYNGFAVGIITGYAFAAIASLLIITIVYNKGGKKRGK
jgi:hypothetical protein